MDTMLERSHARGCLQQLEVEKFICICARFPPAGYISLSVTSLVLVCPAHVSLGKLPLCAFGPMTGPCKSPWELKGFRAALELSHMASRPVHLRRCGDYNSGIPLFLDRSPSAMADSLLGSPMPRAIRGPHGHSQSRTTFPRSNNSF